MDIILFGMQGSGKGTQAKLLLASGSYSYFSVGDILRERVKKKDALGVEINDLMMQGKLVSDEIIFSVLAHFLKEALYADKAIVFDGFPRTLTQYELLKKILHSNKREYTCIYFDLTFAKTVERIEMRKNIENVRSDDKEMKTIMARLEAFFMHTFPVISRTLMEGKLHIIDAAPGVEEIFEEIKAIVKK